MTPTMHILIEFTLRLLLALVLGGIIGLEREYRSKEAGFRTHFLVCLGSALFCLVSQYGFGEMTKDVSRVAAQVVSGIGFLGAGTIIFQKNVVRGLTTAAGLWVTAAIGLACGTGLYAVHSHCAGAFRPRSNQCHFTPNGHDHPGAEVYRQFKAKREASGGANKARLHGTLFLRAERPANG